MNSSSGGSKDDEATRQKLAEDLVVELETHQRMVRQVVGLIRDVANQCDLYHTHQLEKGGVASNIYTFDNTAIATSTHLSNEGGRSTPLVVIQSPDFDLNVSFITSSENPFIKLTIKKSDDLTSEALSKWQKALASNENPFGISVNNVPIEVLNYLDIKLNKCLESMSQVDEAILDFDRLFRLSKLCLTEGERDEDLIRGNFIDNRKLKRGEHTLVALSVRLPESKFSAGGNFPWLKLSGNGYVAIIVLKQGLPPEISFKSTGTPEECLVKYGLNPAQRLDVGQFKPISLVPKALLDFINNELTEFEIS